MGVLLCCSLPHSLEIGPLTEPEAQLGWPTSELMGSICLCFSVLGFQAHITMLGFFVWVLEI